LKTEFPKVAIGDVAEINPTLPRTIAEQRASKVSFVPMAYVSEEGFIAKEDERSLGDVSKGYTYFARGDVIVAKITPCVENGKAAYTSNLKHEVGFGTTEFHVLRPGPNIDGCYLFYMIWNPHFRFVAAHNMTGSAGQRRVPAGFVRRFTIPLPPLPEQKRIAAILDQADAIRRKRQQALQNVTEISVAVFHQMFGNLVDDDTATTSTLRELGVEFRYGTSNKSEPNGFPTLRIPNVLVAALDLADLKNVPVEPSEFKRLKLRDGDLLFVRTNGNPDYVGRCAVFDPQLIAAAGHDPEQFIYASYLIRGRIDPSVLNPRYLRAFLDTSRGRRMVRTQCRTSAGQYNINTEGLGSLTLPVPPIEKQNEFARRLKHVILLEGKAASGITESNSLFDSLVQRAFRGEL
jgi:type I restriction enzyme S subunit